VAVAAAVAAVAAAVAAVVTAEAAAVAVVAAAAAEEDRKVLEKALSTRYFSVGLELDMSRVHTYLPSRFLKKLT
jgi:hypothetical protein